MRVLRALMVCAGLAACQPVASPVPPVNPAPSPAANTAPDMAPNADAARYGPHGVATTPPPVPTTPPPTPTAEPAAGAPDSAPAGEDSLADMRGHPCECGKTCHCGHCSGAVPGCHCHIKRADGKE